MEHLMKPAIRVRPSQTADAAAVGQVLLSSYPTLMAQAYEHDVLVLALPLMTRPNPKLLGCGTYYIAQTDDEIVGCGGWSREEPGSNVVVPGTAHIRHFAVKPDWVRRGVGRALFDRCEADARAQGICLFRCFASLNAVGFYRLLGFGDRGVINVAMGPGVSLPSMLMERPL
jgi:ribosomal protein S18 acetylase RimI-like enzyme